MRTSGSDIERAENYISGKLGKAEALLFEARMLCNPSLKKEVRLLEKIYHLVGYYHRKKLKEESEVVHQKLFSDPEKIEFQQTIFRIFNP
jgi:hypothetical protein